MKKIFVRLAVLAGIVLSVIGVTGATGAAADRDMTHNGVCVTCMTHD